MTKGRLEVKNPLAVSKCHEAYKQELLSIYIVCLWLQPGKGAGKIDRTFEENIYSSKKKEKRKKSHLQ